MKKEEIELARRYYYRHAKQHSTTDGVNIASMMASYAASIHLKLDEANERIKYLTQATIDQYNAGKASVEGQLDVAVRATNDAHKLANQAHGELVHLRRTIQEISAFTHDCRLIGDGSIFMNPQETKKFKALLAKGERCEHQ